MTQSPGISHVPTGRFITFEGIDGAGKTSHLDELERRWRETGRDVVRTREPGGTPLAESLRELVLHRPMDALTESLLVFAARRDHLLTVIEPALARGAWVLCDRFTDATYAYQVGGRGLDEARFAALERWVHPDFQPDLTLIFDLDPEVAARRLAGTGQAPDRFEREKVDFFQRVRAAYLRRAAAAPQRVRLIDASRKPDEIRAEVEAVIAGVCFQ